MKKLVVLAVISALAIAACGGAGSRAATVNGTTITVGEVEALVFQPEPAPIPVQAFAADLDFLIRLHALSDAANEVYGISVTEEEISAESDEIIAANSAPGQSREQVLEAARRTESYLRALAQLIVLQQKILAELSAEVDDPTAEQIAEGLHEVMAELTEVCASHILVDEEDEDLARQLLDRALDGEDFADLAEEYGTDGTAANGGELGCSPASRYVPEFRDATMIAPVGTVHEQLVQTQFGWHLILVTERTHPEDEDIPSEDEVRALLIEQRALTLFQPWFADQLRGADVTVEARFGTWETVPQPRVVAPAQ